MRIGVISDIHANIHGLQAVLRELREKRVELILCAGDVVGYYPFVNEVCDLVRQWEMVVVKGNHDCYVLEELPVAVSQRQECSLDYTTGVISDENLCWLRTLPGGYEACLDGVHVSMYHGSPWDRYEGYVYPDFRHLDRFREIDADLIILGHTHHPMVKQISDRLVLNSGSCGQPRDYDPRASYTLFDTVTRQIEIGRTPYDIDRVAIETRRQGLSDKLIHILYRTRD